MSSLGHDRTYMHHTEDTLGGHWQHDCTTPCTVSNVRIPHLVGPDNPDHGGPQHQSLNSDPHTEKVTITIPGVCLRTTKDGVGLMTTWSHASHDHSVRLVLTNLAPLWRHQQRARYRTRMTNEQDGTPYWEYNYARLYGSRWERYVNLGQQITLLTVENKSSSVRPYPWAIKGQTLLFLPTHAPL
jgi:hypothetical protein